MLSRATAWWADHGGDVPSFETLAAITPAVEPTNVSSLASNAIDAAAGQRVIFVSGSARDTSNRTFTNPAPAWGTFTTHATLTPIVGTQRAMLAVASGNVTTPISAEATTLAWSGTLYGLVSAALVVPKASIVRQVKTATIEGTTTPISATFDASILSTSLIVAAAVVRAASTITFSAGFDEAFDVTPVASSQLAVASRVGHDSDTASVTVSGSTVAKGLVLLEIANPGEEL